MHNIRSVWSSVTRRVSMVATAWRQLAVTFVDSNLGTVVAFCSIGLLIGINLILRFPDISALIVQYNLF